jgi:hypothetical protein
VIAVSGIDIGQNSFHVVGLDERGEIVLRQMWPRGVAIYGRQTKGATVESHHVGITVTKPDGRVPAEVAPEVKHEDQP